MSSSYREYAPSSFGPRIRAAGRPLHVSGLFRSCAPDATKKEKAVAPGAICAESDRLMLCLSFKAARVHPGHVQIQSGDVWEETRITLQKTVARCKDDKSTSEGPSRTRGQRRTNSFI